MQSRHEVTGMQQESGVGREYLPRVDYVRAKDFANVDVASCSEFRLKRQGAGGYYFSYRWGNVAWRTWRTPGSCNRRIGLTTNRYQIEVITATKICCRLHISHPFCDCQRGNELKQ